MLFSVHCGGDIVDGRYVETDERPADTINILDRIE